MTEIAIQLIRPDDEALLDAAFALYSDAIEKSEQRTEAVFRALIHRPDYRFLSAMLDGRLIGVSVAWVPPGANCWLLEYAAVAPDMRGKAVGANLFFATRMLAGQERAALIEVDADLGAPEQARRLSFYRRLGCRRFAGVDYILPLDAFGTPPPMWLLCLPPENALGVSVHAVEAWLRAIYSDVYGKPLDDPRLAKMIDPLPDVVNLVEI